MESVKTAGLLFTDFRVVDQDGKPFWEGTFLDYHRVFKEVRKTPIRDGVFLIQQEEAFARLVGGNFIGTSSVVIPKHVLEDVGPFDETLKNGDDGDMWFRIARRYDLVYLDCVGHNYRRFRPGSIGSRGDWRRGPNRIKVLKRQREIGVPEHLVATLRHRIARNYFEIGYACQCQNNTKLARENYLLGLREEVTWPLLRGVLVTLLGPRLLADGRRARNWLRKRLLGRDEEPRAPGGVI